ncbi:TrmB family transcriptional regulator [Halomicrococcus sp. NG-SE-24]|uniref:TrmB family transcriptional regulator n=1 Tax=Halomicrococcus sp. NG-SE-24 TaxID=3436928 RepID=UPI003D9838B5
MTPGDLRDGLEEAGLTEYEISTYVALLNMGSAPATELAEKGDVPRSRVYDILRDLEEKGYAETYEQDSLHARAREPTDVFEKLQSKARTLERTAEEIQERWEQAGIDGHRVSFVKRFDTVFERAKAAIRDAENHVDLSLTPDQFGRLEPLLREAYEDDIIVTVSFNTSPERPSSPPDDDELTGAVTEARHRNLPAPFVLIVDRDVTCFAPHTEPVDQYGVIFEDKELTYVLHWYFQAALWESWPTIFSARSTTLPAVYVDVRECIRDILPVLSDGDVITATIEGQTIGRGNEREITGTIEDVIYANGPTDESTVVPTLSNLAGRAAIVLETDDGDEYTIGGWGATLETIEARRIHIESVQYGEDAG